MEGVQKWELRERDIRLLYFVVGSSILLEFYLISVPSLKMDRYQRLRSMRSRMKA